MNGALASSHRLLDRVLNDLVSLVIELAHILVTTFLCILRLPVQRLSSTLPYLGLTPVCGMYQTLRSAMTSLVSPECRYAGEALASAAKLSWYRFDGMIRGRGHSALFSYALFLSGSSKRLISDFEDTSEFSRIISSAFLILKHPLPTGGKRSTCHMYIGLEDGERLVHHQA